MVFPRQARGCDAEHAPVPAGVRLHDHRAPQAVGRALDPARASATTRRSRVCRSALRDERSRAIPAATAGSRAPRTARGRGAPCRSGPPRSGAARCGTQRPRTSAPRPARAPPPRAGRADLVPGDEESAARPSAAMTRFSPSSGTRSAIVPRHAARSSESLESETPGPTAPTACAIFMAMAEAASSLYGYMYSVRTVRFDPDHGRRELLEKCHHLLAPKLLAQNRLLGGIHPVKLENVLRRVHPNSANLFHGRFPLSEICNDLILARSMPSGPFTPTGGTDSFV